MRRLLRGPGPIALLVLLLGAIHGCGSQGPAIDRLPTLEMTWRSLWNADSDSIEDWMVLRSPRDMLVGPQGELIISDSGNSRVIRFSRDAELIQVIGSTGEGPGQFLEPRDLAYDEADSTLWVFERSTRRQVVSRFHFDGRDFEFSDSFHASSIGFGGIAGTVLAGPRTFFMAGTGIEQRICLIDENNKILASFGDFWLPDQAREYPGTRWLLNRGFLRGVGDSALVFLYDARPVVELWDRGGTLQQVRQLQSKELKASDRRRNSRPEAVKVYFTGMATDQSDHWTFLVPYTQSGFVAYGCSTADLEPMLVLRCDFPVRVVLSCLVAITAEDSTVMYAFDRVSGAVLELHANTGGVLPLQGSKNVQMGP